MVGKDLHPLHGVPVSIKDMHQTKGLRTTFGSLIFKDNMPDQDEVPVSRLREAGAIILGKTNTPEFGLSGSTENLLGEDCRNPWNMERTSGGSSGGAAASVAAGLGPFGLGTDGAGSVRIPAGFCGVYGLKPTFGRTPVAGSPSFVVMGPISRTVRDAALMLDVIAGYDASDPNSIRESPPCFVDALEGGIEGLAVAWSSDLGYASVDPEVRAVGASAALVFESLGCRVDESTPESGEPFSTHEVIQPANFYAGRGKFLHEHAEKLMPYVKQRLEEGEKIAGHEYATALKAMTIYQQRMDDFFERYDLLLVPSDAVPAFPVGQRPEKIDGQEVDWFWGPFPMTLPFNLTGQPVANVPCGYSSEGLPIGLQVIGRKGDEATVLRASAAFEHAQPWAQDIPQLL